MNQNIRGTLTSEDSHQYIQHRFTMPAGAQNLHLDFVYEPKKVGDYRNLLTLSLFDPDIERGTGHRGGATQSVDVSAGSATPGYLAGALQEGEWMVVINTNLINPGADVHYTLDIVVSFEEMPTVDAVPAPGQTAPRGPGWYRGELHSHTLHSDGHWTPEGLVEYERARGLDFVTLTDHNTVSGLAIMDSLSRDDLLTMGGFEITSFYGHALALGLRQMIDWRVVEGVRSIEQIKAEIEAAGGTFVMAHPMALGDPYCTGCHWDYVDLMPGSVRIVEIWNEHWDSASNNEQALQLYYGWLNEGHRLVATVGADIHGTPAPELEFGQVVVYAEDLNEEAILQAINAGHLYLSSGPTLSLTAQSAGGDAVMMGDELHGAACQLTYTWDQCREGDMVRLIVDGAVKNEISAKTSGENTMNLLEGHWFTVEIRDAQGGLRAISNPIFWRH